jgi:hypothetical protein
MTTELKNLEKNLDILQKNLEFYPRETLKKQYTNGYYRLVKEIQNDASYVFQIYVLGGLKAHVSFVDSIKKFVVEKGYLTAAGNALINDLNLDKFFEIMDQCRAEIMRNFPVITD